MGWMVALLAGCAPPPLTEAPPDARQFDTSISSDDADDDTAGGSDTSFDTAPPPDSKPGDTAGPSDSDSGDSGTPTPPFSEVATIIGDRCAESNCHGQPPFPNIGFQIGSNSPSQMQVRSSLEGKSIDDPQAALVEPGQPKQSGIYQALEALEGRSEMPPPMQRRPLSASKVLTIRKWIAGGAPYE